MSVTPEVIRRRALLRGLATSGVLVGTVGCGALARTVGFRPEPESHTPFIMRTENLFVVAVDPSYKPPVTIENVASAWALDVVGVDGRRTQLGYEELSLLATRRVLYTLECVGNPVGGQLIGNVGWDVVPLREILRRAPGGMTAALTVRCEALDGFFSSVSIRRAAADDAFLALRMNGEPLTPEHGFPARVLLPDLYGKKQPRWLGRIVLSGESRTDSYWERRGWAGEVPVKTMSRIDPPGRLSAEPAELSGIAFAGRRAIRQVEVSIDGGPWSPCVLMRAPEPNVWSGWQYRWETPVSGRHLVRVRAIDGRGVVQTEAHQGSFPDGASGYHEMQVDVV